MRLFSSLKRLEEELRKCPKVSVPEDKKNILKKQIMSAVKRSPQVAAGVEEERGFEGVIEKMREFALQVVPDRYFQTLLKEKLMALASFHFQKGPSWTSFFGRMVSRRVFAGTVAAVFVFTLLFNFTFRIERVEASAVTLLESFSGSVTVIREGHEIPASSGFLLRTDDTIRTGPNSRAAILFMDQSVSRLDENTEVKISKLFVNPLNKTQTVVELILHRGQMWSRVINLIDNFSRFQVKAENTVAVAKRRAAFNVSVSPKKQATVAAIQNQVDLVVATDKKVVETTLVKGFSAEINTSTLPSALQIAPGKTPEPENTWVADNLAEDKVYIEGVKEEMKEQLRDQIKMQPGNPLYAMKEFSEGAKIALTFNEIERRQKILIMAEERFAEAQLYLERGDRVKAAEALATFKSQIQEILAWVKRFEVAHPLEAAEFRAQVISMLSGYEKKLTVILPVDVLYELKTAVAEISVDAAQSPSEKTEKKLSQAGDRLLEANDLVEQGDVTGAKERVEAYTSAVSEVASEVKQMANDEKEKAVSALLETNMEDLKMLESITEVMKDTETATLPAAPAPVSASLAPQELVGTIPTDKPAGESAELAPVVGGDATAPAPTSVDVPVPLSLKQTVDDAKSVALEQLGEAVLDVQQNQPSAEVLQKLQDIKGLDVNGKPLVNVIMPPTGGLKIQGLPPARP